VVIIEVSSTGERVTAHIVEEDPAAPLAVTLGSIVLVRYTLAPLVEGGGGWRVVEASPQERAVLAAHGIMVQER
jgi:hypothetical protein